MRRTFVSRVNCGYWKHIRNQRFFFDEHLTEELGIRSSTDWYKVKSMDILSCGGQSILEYYYGGSLFYALKSLYPEHSWFAWMFERLPYHYWDNDANQKRFFDWYFEFMKMKTLDDWYTTKSKDISRLGGRQLLEDHHKGSLPNALFTIYPHHTWDMQKISTISDNNNNNNNNNSYKTHQSYKPLVDVPIVSKVQHWLHTRFVEENSSNRHPWIDGKVPRDFWKEKKNIHSYLKWISEKLLINKMTDWRNVSCHQMLALRATTVLNKYGGLYKLLTHFFPFVSTKFAKYNSQFPTTPSKAQQQLHKCLQDIFPHFDIEFNHRIYFSTWTSTRSQSECISKSISQLSQSQNGRYFPKKIELDLLISNADLALEYQGIQHFLWNHRFGSPTNSMFYFGTLY